MVELARTAPGVRTVVLSAQPDPELEERVLLAGASGYMTQPVFDETLLRALEGVAVPARSSARARSLIGWSTACGPFPGRVRAYARSAAG